MTIIVKNNIKDYEKLYKSGLNHQYPNLDLVRISRKYLSKNIGKTLDFGFGTGENLIFLVIALVIYWVVGLVTLKIFKKEIRTKTIFIVFIPE